MALPEPKSEEQIQIYFVNWVHREYPDLWPWLHHSPNGGFRSKAAGGKFKLMGVKPGYPDLHLHVGIGKFNGLVIEMKKQDGTVSLDQMAWLDHFKSQGQKTAVCWTLAQAQTEFMEYARAANDG